MGAQKFKGKVVIPAFGQGGGADLKYADLLISNAELKAIRATPKTLVPAPGTGKVLEFLSAVVVLAAGTNVLTEATANLAVKYQNGAGVQVSQTVEMTGFIDQAAHQVTYALPKLDPITARSACENQPLVLHNLGAARVRGQRCERCDAACEGRLPRSHLRFLVTNGIYTLRRAQRGVPQNLRDLGHLPASSRCTVCGQRHLAEGHGRGAPSGRSVRAPVHQPFRLRRPARAGRRGER